MCTNQTILFFRGELSNFVSLCFNHMKTNNAKNVLELGAGHGINTTFLDGSNGIEVEALLFCDCL